MTKIYKFLNKLFNRMNYFESNLISISKIDK